MEQTTNEQKDIKLIVLDLDGTLLNSKHTVSERNLGALRAAIAQGVKVMLATGKTFYSATSIIAALNLDLPSVFVQGLMVYNADGTIRHQQTIPSQALRRIIPYAESRGFSCIIYSGTRILAKAKDATTAELVAYGEPEAEAVGSLVNIIDRIPVNKIILVGSDVKAVKALRWQLDKQMDGQVALVTTPILKQHLEVLPQGVSKGKTVQALVRELGISADKVMAMGDGENDLELLQFAGWGVAMANADPKLKQIAQAVVGTNDQDGVAEAIERFVLPPAPVAPKAEEKPAEGESANE